MHMPPSRKRKAKLTSFADMDADEDYAGDAEMPEAVALADELIGDHTYGNHAQRPAWYKHIYGQLWHANWTAHGHRLMCSLCHNQIQLTANSPAGLEVYAAALNYQEQTRPHIDHHSPDWLDRAVTVQSILLHAAPPLTRAQERHVLNSAFNAPPLRIVHRKCNLGRSKAAGVVHSGFGKQIKTLTGV